MIVYRYSDKSATLAFKHTCLHKHGQSCGQSYVSKLVKHFHTNSLVIFAIMSFERERKGYIHRQGSVHSARHLIHLRQQQLYRPCKSRHSLRVWSQLLGFQASLETSGKNVNL